MIRLTVNGEAKDTPAETVAALWEAETSDLALSSPKGFAIALNGEVVRAARWDATRLRDGDAVEIVRALAGG